MKQRRKDYSLNTDAISDNSVVDGPCPWVWQTSLRKIDFKRWQHLLGDYSQPLVERGELLNQCRNAIWGIRYELTNVSIANLVESGLKILFIYIDETGIDLKSIDAISSECMASLTFWLKNAKNSRTGKTVSYVTARRRYSAIKTILSFYGRQGLFDMKLLPTNPFPNVNRAGKGYEPYSRTEMQRIMKILFAELKAIRQGSFLFSQRVQMAIYQLIIMANTGINKTPLEEASRDCLKPHPLQPDKVSLLLTYKRRGMNTYAISLRNSKLISNMDSLPNSVADIIKEAIKITDHLVIDAKQQDKDRIWLYQTENPKKVSSFKSLCIHKCASIISTHHNLKNDQGEPLTISASRLRKTFATRIWQLTGGDIWKTARILGNTPRVTDQHYLDITPTMEKNHHFVGIAMEINVRGQQKEPEIISQFAHDAGISVDSASTVLSGKNNTAVARCSNPVSGKYAKGDGSPCTRFLDCFRCPNQIVLRDDLYRLYSFYWLILSERTFIGKKKWKRLYAWVVREIDKQIAPHFSCDEITRAKEKARVEPHMMWKQRDILGGEL